MIEINLLPWRMNGHDGQKRQQKQWLVGIFCLLVLMFFLQHFVLYSIIKNHHLLAIKLATKLPNQPAVQMQNDENGLVSLAAAVTSKRQALQQQLGNLGRMGAHRVRLTKINYRQNQIYFFGYASSVNELSQWVSATDAGDNPVKIIQVKRAQGLLQFVAVTNI